MPATMLRRLLGTTAAASMTALPLAACSDSPTASTAGVAQAGSFSPAVGPPTVTVAAAANGKIAFASTRDGNDEIYVMSRQGS